MQSFRDEHSQVSSSTQTTWYVSWLGVNEMSALGMFTLYHLASGLRIEHFLPRPQSSCLHIAPACEENNLRPVNFWRSCLNPEKTTYIEDVNQYYKRCQYALDVRDNSQQLTETTMTMMLELDINMLKQSSQVLKHFKGTTIHMSLKQCQRNQVFFLN